MRIEIEVGRKLFEFTSEADWVNRAKALYQAFGHTCDTTIAVDARGREVVCGACFGRAQEDDEYPITVYVSSSTHAQKYDEYLRLQECEVRNER